MLALSVCKLVVCRAAKVALLQVGMPYWASDWWDGYYWDYNTGDGNGVVANQTMYLLASLPRGPNQVLYHPMMPMVLPMFSHRMTMMSGLCHLF